MRIVFFGTPAFAVPSLDALLDEGESVVAVVTQPDRPRGRSRSTLEPSPVKRRALAANLPVLQPERPIGDQFIAALTEVKPDLGVVVAYGHILRPTVLGIPRHGMINVHASLLPAWRGAAPIQWSILAGDRETGVTVMQMETGLDRGPIVHTARTAIGPDETAGQLTERLAVLGASALREALVRFHGGPVAGAAQDHDRATLAPKVDRGLARLRWAEPAARVAQRLRAFDPVPGAWTTLGRSRHPEGGPSGPTEGSLVLKLFNPRVRGFSGPPGSVLVAGPELVIAAGLGSIAVGEIQPAGTTRMPIEAWLRGHPIKIGDRFQ